MRAGTPRQINDRLAGAQRLRLFLDYDGTLDDFAPTPEHVNPSAEVIESLTTLAGHPRIRIAVISGRRLSQVKALLPVPGILLAGTYGIELRTPKGRQISRLAHDAIRPVLDTLKPRWQDLISGYEGFFVEDKGWALALHARFATAEEAQEILTAARSMAIESSSPQLFRILGGHKFLELAPRLAHKGQTVEYILDHFPWPGALPIYVGDDDKDEEAFEAIHKRGGIAIIVAQEPGDTQADFRLPSPQATRQWLETVPKCLDIQNPTA